MTASSTFHPTICALLGLREGLRRLDVDVDDNVYACLREDGVACLVVVADDLTSAPFVCGKYERGAADFAAEWSAAVMGASAEQSAKYWTDFPNQQGVVTVLITKGFISKAMKAFGQQLAAAEGS